METIDIIVTRYNEHLDWLRYLPINLIRTIFIYNKGENETFFKKFLPTDDLKDKMIIKKLPNIGRIDHTITYHILETWDNPADILVSLPGSIMMCRMKGAYLNYIMKNLKHVKTKYNGFYSPRFHVVSPRFNYFIDDYQAEGKCNRNNNPFIKSEYPDFVTWKNAIIDQVPIKFVSMRGMFSVCKENIKHIDKDVYERLLGSLSVGDNIENGHFAERIWAHLFKRMSHVA